VRAVGAVAGLVVALAATPRASAQPGQPTAPAQPGQPTAGPQAASWRSAVSAALAFGHAEGKAAALTQVAFPTAPATQKAMEAALDEFDRAATAARKAFAEVERHRSAYWTAAAEIRIGDTFACQANRLVTVFPQLTGRLQPDILEGLVQPLRDAARPHWQRAEAIAERSGISPHALLLVAGPPC